MSPVEIPKSEEVNCSAKLTSGGALHGARIVCDAMRCAVGWFIPAMHGMRYNSLRAGCDARDAMQCAARGLVAGGAMLLTEGFLGWLSRFKLIRLRRISLATLPRYGRMGGRRDGWMAGV